MPPRKRLSRDGPPRLVVVPAWGTEGGPWTQLRDGWPGPTAIYYGAGTQLAG